MKHCRIKFSSATFHKPLFLVILFLSLLPFNSNSQLSSFYSFIPKISSYSNSTNTSSKIKRSSVFTSINGTSLITPFFGHEEFRGKSEDISDIIIPFPTVLLKKVENLTFFQSLLQNIAATRAREELAEVSSHWANKAHSVVSSKYKEVIHLTRATHEAQLLSLERASIAQLLTDAVFKAHRVYQSSRKK